MSFVRLFRLRKSPDIRQSSAIASMESPSEPLYILLERCSTAASLLVTRTMVMPIESKFWGKFNHFEEGFCTTTASP